MLGSPSMGDLDDDSDVPGAFESTKPQGISGLNEPGRKRGAQLNATMAPWASRGEDSNLSGGSMLPHGSTQFSVGRQPGGDSKLSTSDPDGSSTSFGLPTARKSLKPAHAPAPPETSARHGKVVSGGDAVQRRTSVGLPRLDSDGEPSLEKTWVPGVTDEIQTHRKGESPRTMSIFGLAAPNRKTLLGAPPVAQDDGPADSPMTQAVGYHKLEPKRRSKPRQSTDLGPARPGKTNSPRGNAPGAGLFKFPPRKSGEGTPPERGAKPRSTLLGTPAIDAGKAAPSKETSPGAYVFKKTDISRSSQAVRISSSISARRLTPPSQRALDADIGRTQQISMPAFGELAEELERGVKDTDADAIFGHASETAHDPGDSGAQFGEDPGGDDLFGDDGFVDEAFADEAIATLGGAADLVGAPGQLPPSEDEGDSTDVQVFDPIRARESAMVEGGRTMQISLPAAALDENLEDEAFGHDGSGEDEDSPLATQQMVLPPPDFAKRQLAHADTSELDQVADAKAESRDELADTADNLEVSPEVVAAATAEVSDAEDGLATTAPEDSDAYVAWSADPPPEQVGAPAPQTAIAARAPAEPAEAVVRMLGAAAGAAMLLGVVFQVFATGLDQFGTLSPLTQVSMAFPVLGGLLVLGASALRFPPGMRALIIGLVGVIATMLVSATDLAPLGELGGLARRGTMAVSFVLPMALLWRARYPQAFTSRIVVAAGILMVVANFAFLDFILGDLGRPMAVVLVDLAGQGAVGAIVAGLAAVPVLLAIPSLLAFRGSHTDGLGSVWAGLYLAWTLMMPVAAGALAAQTSGSPAALLAYVGAGLAVFAAATAFCVGFSETFGRLTTLPNRDS